jgi:hypothetical protein
MPATDVGRATQEGDNLQALDAPTVDALGVILAATLAELYGLTLR